MTENFYEKVVFKILTADYLLQKSFGTIKFIIWEKWASFLWYWCKSIYLREKISTL